jgi:hypothetical protein
VLGALIERERAVGPLPVGAQDAVITEARELLCWIGALDERGVALHDLPFEGR